MEKKIRPILKFIAKVDMYIVSQAKTFSEFFGKVPIHCTTLEFTRMFFDQSLYNLKKNS